MQINITGMTPRIDKKILDMAARFFASQLMDPRMVRNITLDIEVRKNMDVHGECVDEDGIRNPRFFTIGLKKQNLEEMIKTLAHEMVHVKQHAKNELQSGIVVPTRGGIKMYSKWQGELWKPKGKENAYWDAPWEIEAYGREVGLYQKWNATVKEGLKAL